jgi:hypothetical protein
MPLRFHHDMMRRETDEHIDHATRAAVVLDGLASTSSSVGRPM